MKNLTAILCLTFSVLLFSAGEGFALSSCPEDQNQRFHNCFGTFTTNDGMEYVGEWKDNKQHGQGIETSADGDNYIGEFKDGKRHGQGTFTFADGEKYVGEFKDGNYHGQGTYTLPTGTNTLVNGGMT